MKEEGSERGAAIEFDWKNKWLKGLQIYFNLNILWKFCKYLINYNILCFWNEGDEYAYILQNIDVYCDKFQMKKL